MKFLLSILLIIIYLPSHANNLGSFLNGSSFNNICSQAMKYQKVKIPGTDEIRYGYVTTRPVFTESENYIFTSMKDLSSSNLVYKVTKVKKEASASTINISSYRNPIRDLVAINDNKILILFDNYLLINNLNEKQNVSIQLPRVNTFGKNDHAYSMVLKDDIVYIANGTEGVTVVNLLTTKTKNIDLGLVQSTGHYSIAVSVSMTADFSLVVGVDNLTAPSRKSTPFNGVKKVNLNTKRILNFPFDKKRSGVLVRVARTIINNNFLWINNWGTIQTVNLDELNKEKKIRANWLRTIAKDETGHWHFQPVGDFFINENYFYACAKKTDMNAGSNIKDKTVVYKVKIK